MANRIPFEKLPTLDERINLVKRLDSKLYYIGENTISVPFLVNRENFAPRSSFSPIEFCGQLFPFQEKIAHDALDNITIGKSILFSLYCGAGKTIIILWLLARMGLAALIVVPKKTLVGQWKERIQQFCPQLIYHVQTGRTALKSHDWKVVVVDEVHQMLTPGGLCTLLQTCPDYLIGASATPWRPDENYFHLFFNHKLELTRPPTRSTVFVYRTGLTPHVKVCLATNQLDWNSLLTWQANNNERNDQIARVCKSLPRPQLILTKRLTANEELRKRLPDADIIIATFSKLGTGFDDKRLKTLVLASDVVEYFEQYSGRVLRESSGDVLFVEFIDNFGPLWAHWRKREVFYKSIGAHIRWVSLPSPV